MLPHNLVAQGDETDYVVTGAWSKKAYEEGQKFSKANLAAKGDNKSVPAPSSWKLSAAAKYVHYCDNETIGGVEFKVRGSTAAGGVGRRRAMQARMHVACHAGPLHECMLPSSTSLTNRVTCDHLMQSAPNVGDKILIADMSSNFISKPVDVSKYGVIYGGAQKNVGPSGVTIVIIREDLIGHARCVG